MKLSDGAADPVSVPVSTDELCVQYEAEFAAMHRQSSMQAVAFRKLNQQLADLQAKCLDLATRLARYETPEERDETPGR